MKGGGGWGGGGGGGNCGGGEGVGRERGQDNRHCILESTQNSLFVRQCNEFSVLLLLFLYRFYIATVSALEQTRCALCVAVVAVVVVVVVVVLFVYSCCCCCFILLSLFCLLFCLFVCLFGVFFVC